MNTRFSWLCGYYNAAGFPFLPVEPVIDAMHCISLFILQVKQDSFWGRESTDMKGEVLHSIV